MARIQPRKCLPLEMEMLPLYRAETRSLRQVREPRRRTRRLLGRIVTALRAAGTRRSR